MSAEARLISAVGYYKRVISFPYREMYFLHVYINGFKSTAWGAHGAFKWIPQGPKQNEKWFNFALISLLCRDAAALRVSIKISGEL